MSPLRLAALLYFALSLQASPPSATLTIDDVIGIWSGSFEHDGETARIGIEFERRGDAVRTIVMIPAIHGRSGLGPATVNGGRVEAGGVAFDFDPAAQTLTTTLPEGFVPRYRFTVTLRRVASFALPERTEPTAPSRDPAWTIELGAPTWADAAYSAGRVAVGADDGVMHVVSARTGRAVWQFKADGAIRSRAAFIGGDLLVHADDGRVYRLDGRTGAERWRATVADTPATRRSLSDPKGRYENRAASVAVDGRRLFVGTHEGRVVALDADRGRILWTFKAGDSIITTPAVANGRAYVGSFDRHVYALDAATGAMLWKYDTGDAMTSDVAVLGSRVIAGSRSYDLEGLDAVRGTPLWKKYFWFSWVESSPAIYDDVVYIGSSDAAKVFAINGTTGRSVWESDANGSAWAKPAVTASTVYQSVAGVVRYITPHRGSVSAFDRQTGRLVWWHEAKPPEPMPAEPTAYGFAGSVAVGEGLVFAGGLDGRLYAFKQ